MAWGSWGRGSSGSNTGSGSGWGNWRRRYQQNRRTTTNTNTQSRRGPQQIRQHVAGIPGVSDWATQLAAQNDPNRQAAREWWRSNVPMGQRGDYESFIGSAAGPIGGPASPASPGYSGGGGGGGGWGGGGGGGGGGAMTQAMWDAMLQALSARGPQLTLNQVDLPAFRGQN